MEKPLGYIEYHKRNALAWEIDTHLDAAVYFANARELSLEQRYWLAFLTAICETTPTSLLFFEHFPTHTCSAEAFEDFCTQHKGAMAFQYDVRWLLYRIRNESKAHSY